MEEHGSLSATDYTALVKLQGELARLYDLPTAHSIADYVCDADVAEAVVGATEMRRELVVVYQTDDALQLGVYLDPDVVRASQAAHEQWAANALPTDAASFDAWCAALEGVSHFVYLTHRAEHGDTVRAIELELQAEIDKYVLALEATPSGDARLTTSRTLRRRLYEHVTYRDAETTEAGERYRLANQLAWRYTQRLEEHYAERASGLPHHELRRFYRAGWHDKLQSIERAR